MKNIFTFILILFTLAAFSDERSPEPFRFGIGVSTGYGPEQGLPFLGFFAVNLNALFLETIELQVFENLFNSMGTFRSYGAGFSVFLPYSKLKVSYSVSETGHSDVDNSWKSVNTYGGMNFPVEGFSNLETSSGYIQLLVGPCFPFEINNTEKFDKMYPNFFSTKLNFELGFQLYL